MKRLLLISLALAALGMQSQAAWVTYNFSGTLANGGIVPDNDLNGWVSTMDITSSDLVGSGGVKVTLDITDGWNGDLYGYLTHSSGFALLLDRVGGGSYAEAGFANVTLSDVSDSYTDIQSYGGNPFASPALSGGTYNSAGGVLDTAFSGTSVGGQWVLFLADRQTGDISQVSGWSLSIDAVPEPSTWAMIIFAVAFSGWQLWSWRMKRC